METNPLSLVVKEKTLGNLVTNAIDIKAYVKDQLENRYSIENYTGDAKQAAKDKAEINNAIKQLNDRRIALEKEWNMPFMEFKDIVTETTNLLKNASGKLDLIVKAKDEEEKNAKKAEIMQLWESKNFNLVTLEKIFNQKWLNKTYKIATVDADIDMIIKQINGDLDSLDAFGEDTATLKDLYLSTLNLQATLNKGAELKANRERIAEMEARKKAEQEATKAAAENNVGSKEPEVVEVKETVPAAKVEAPAIKKPTSPIYTFNVYGGLNEVESVKAIAEEMQLEIVPSITLKGDVEQINQFKALLADNGMGYDKQGVINLAVKRI